MLKGKGLPQFWVEVVNIVVYILNWCYTKDLKGKAPHEAYTSKKPSISHFWIFGCNYYVHVPNKERKKLQPKSTKCIFLGYSDDMKACTLYNLATINRIVESCDIVFKEQPHAMVDEEKSSTLSH